MLEGNLNIRVQSVDESSEKIEMLLQRLNQIGSSIKLEDDKWICDKMLRDGGDLVSDYTIYFANIPDKYKILFKYFALIRPGKVKVRTISGSASYYKHLFNFLKDKAGYPSLKNVDKKIITNFELYLKETNLAKSSKEGIWYCAKTFFETLAGWNEMPSKPPFGAINPFKRVRKDYKHDSKYIPEFVIKQLDVLFKEETIPVHYKLAYWLLRAIPSRVSEITNMKIDCLKPSYDSNVVLFIPTWKQNGGYLEPELRSIYLNPEGEFEKSLILMIKEQQKAALEIQNNIDKKNNLFTHRHPREQNGEKAYLILNRNLVEDYFRELCIKRNIKDEQGNNYCFTPHQLRHNAITDRIEVGFSFVEIRDMTNHKGNSMIWNAYYHPRKEVVLKRQSELEKKVKESEEVSKPIYFRGRILNLDKQTEERILKNPRAYRIMEGEHSIGICSDITGCKSNMFECLDCDYFAVNVDDLGYFKDQLKIWESKVKMFHGKKQALENAQHNLKLHTSIVERIELQVELLKEENRADGL